MPFLADVDRLLVDFKDTDPDVHNEMNPHFNRYVKAIKEFKADRAVPGLKKQIQVHGLKAGPFDKGAGFCMKQDMDNKNGLHDILCSEQFRDIKNPEEGRRFTHGKSDRI